MGNRSNINLVGNTTFGENVGSGTGVYKGKNLGNVLQLKTLSVTGTTMTITSDADNIYFSAATGGGSGSGFTASNNGLCDNGTTVGLGGTLVNDTTISGGESYQAFSATCMSNICLGSVGTISLNDSAGSANKAVMYGCGSSCVDVGPSHVVLNSNSDGDIIHCVQSSNRCHIFKNGDVYMPDLATCTGETNVLYVNSAGKISSGATGSGGTSLWTEGAGFIYPADGGNFIRLNSNNYIQWSGTSTCVKSNSNALCLINNTSCVHIGDTSIFNKANTTWFTNTSNCVMFITPAGNIATQTASQTICVCGGASGTVTKAGSIHLCGGGASISTGDGGDVVLRGGTSTGGNVGRIQMPTLPVKSSETCGIYIDGSGNLSTGLISGGSGGGLTATSNGISDDGTTVRLGGTLTGETCIDLNNQDLYLTDADNCGMVISTTGATTCVDIGDTGEGILSNYLQVRDNYFVAKATSSVNGCFGVINLSSSGSYLCHNNSGNTAIRNIVLQPSNLVGIRFSASDNAGNAAQMNISDGCVFVSGSKSVGGFSGITYEANYCTYFTPRSLVDKAYVDAAAGGSSAGASGDTQLSDGSGGFICSPVGDMQQITGGSWIQGLSNTITGPSSYLSEAHGWGNSIENAIYSYAFGYNNCICCTVSGVYGSILMGDSNYDNYSFGGNVLMGNANTAWDEASYGVALGFNNSLCCEPTGGADTGVLLGDSNDGFGTTPVGIGSANSVCNYGVGIGFSNDVSGDLGIGIGYGNRICIGAIGGIGLGDGNTVCSGACGAFAHGNCAIADVPAERVGSAGGVNDAVFGGAAIASRGSFREINFFGYTSGSTSPVAQLQTYRSPSFTDRYFDLTPRVHALGFNVIVTGTDLTTNDSAAFFFQGAIKMNGSGGTVSWIGTPTKTCFVDGGFNVNADIFANNTDKRLDICVTGETSTCIGWAATLYGNQIRKFE